MISTADVQIAIISKLKADAPLVALVDEDIREEMWMGTSYDYPCVRVHVTELSPLESTSNCDVFRLNFNVSYRAVSPSSKSTADGIKIAVEALKGQKLEGPNFVMRTKVIVTRVIGPVPEAEDCWMSRGFFLARLQET